MQVEKYKLCALMAINSDVYVFKVALEGKKK